MRACFQFMLSPICRHNPVQAALQHELPKWEGCLLRSCPACCRRVGELVSPACCRRVGELVPVVAAGDAGHHRERGVLAIHWKGIASACK